MKVFISCLKIVFKQVVNISKHLFSSIPNLQLIEEGAEEEGAVRFKGDNVWWVLTRIAFSPATQRERDKNCSVVMMGKELRRMTVGSVTCLLNPVAF